MIGRRIARLEEEKTVDQKKAINQQKTTNSKRYTLCFKGKMKEANERGVERGGGSG